MRKTDRKTENAIRSALTEACEAALEEFEGFIWLTHSVDFRNVAGSLVVLCVFDTTDNLVNVDGKSMRELVADKLNAIGIRLRDARRQIIFDTEENRPKATVALVSPTRH